MCFFSREFDSRSSQVWNTHARATVTYHGETHTRNFSRTLLSSQILILAIRSVAEASLDQKKSTTVRGGGTQHALRFLRSRKDNYFSNSEHHLTSSHEFEKSAVNFVWIARYLDWKEQFRISADLFAWFVLISF